MNIFLKKLISSKWKKSWRHQNRTHSFIIFLVFWLWGSMFALSSLFRHQLQNVLFQVGNNVVFSQFTDFIKPHAFESKSVRLFGENTLFSASTVCASNKVVMSSIPVPYSFFSRRKNSFLNNWLNVFCRFKTQMRPWFDITHWKWF